MHALLPMGSGRSTARVRCRVCPTSAVRSRYEYIVVSPIFCVPNGMEQNPPPRRESGVRIEDQLAKVAKVILPSSSLRVVSGHTHSQRQHTRELKGVHGATF